jgi:hypothetical protein
MKLNELDVVVGLRLHQIVTVEGGGIPASLSNALIFTTANLRRLRARISELDDEQEEARQRLRTRGADVKALERRLKEWDVKIEELRARVLDVQMLKFGRKIELDKLDSMTVNREAEELKFDLASVDVQRLREVETWDVSCCSHCFLFEYNEIWVGLLALRFGLRRRARSCRP